MKNKIASEIVKRIKYAHRWKKTFRVIVVLPAVPEGSVEDENVLTIMKWQYQTICRGEKSILGQLRQIMSEEEVSQYISFYCLRSYDYIRCRNGLFYPVSEQVYVHSKLMIVDDRYVILGSANINDRSMKGTRDSEIGVLIRDTNVVNIEMDGKPHQGSQFAHSLRCYLWRVHLGCIVMKNDLKGISARNDPLPLLDPVCDTAYYGMWMRRAKVNTTLFEHCFPGIPSNRLTSLKKYLKTQPLKPGEGLGFTREYLRRVQLSMRSVLDSSANLMAATPRPLVPSAHSPRSDVEYHQPQFSDMPTSHSCSSFSTFDSSSSRPPNHDNEPTDHTNQNQNQTIGSTDTLATISPSSFSSRETTPTTVFASSKRSDILQSQLGDLRSSPPAHPSQHQQQQHHELQEASTSLSSPLPVSDPASASSKAKETRSREAGPEERKAPPCVPRLLIRRCEEPDLVVKESMSVPSNSIPEYSATSAIARQKTLYEMSTQESTGGAARERGDVEECRSDGGVKEKGAGGDGKQSQMYLLSPPHELPRIRGQLCMYPLDFIEKSSIEITSIWRKIPARIFDDSLQLAV